MKKKLQLALSSAGRSGSLTSQFTLLQQWPVTAHFRVGCHLFQFQADIPHFRSEIPAPHLSAVIEHTGWWDKDQTQQCVRGKCDRFPQSPSTLFEAKDLPFADTLCLFLGSSPRQMDARVQIHGIRGEKNSSGECRVTSGHLAANYS